MRRVLCPVFAVAAVSMAFAASPASAAPFGIVSLGSSGSAIVDHDSVTGDDRGGIAVSTSRVFYTGDSATGRFSITDLTGGASTGSRYDSIAGNIRTGDVYVFGEGGFPATGGDVADRLLGINGSTGALSGANIMLSAPISFPGTTDTGIFSGSDRIVVVASSIAYSIALPSGTVTNLGTVAPLNAFTCESWFYRGVVEEMNSQIYVTYRDTTGDRIVRTRLATGTTTLVSSFTDLSDLCSFTVWPTLNRWYFHYEGNAQFGGLFETVGYASAVFAISFTDSDGDGPVDLGDNCPGVANPTQLDADGDLIGDECDPCPNDPDIDGDGACEEDNCPNTANPGQEDSDGDDFGDACDFCAGPGTTDSDGDGACNGFDNCYFANPDQADLDSDGAGDVCDDVDNALALKSGSMKGKPEGITVMAKGTIVQSVPFFDSPDASDGVYVEVYDNAHIYLDLLFSAAECVTGTKSIVCQNTDGSATLQIKLRAEATGKVPFKLKWNTGIGLPPVFVGPFVLRLQDVATSVDRQGSAGYCSSWPVKLICKQP
jgi:hypothetical protein